MGKERELRAVLQSSGSVTAPAVEELLDEIERQTPSFRLMMSNVQVLVQLEAPDVPVRLQAVEPSEIVRRIVDRYISVAAQSQKEITWWTEPSEFGIVSSDSSAIEHVLTNLVGNAVRFATTHVEVKLSKNPTHFFIRVWEDGLGIAPQYVQHIFDRGWTPEVARGEDQLRPGTLHSKNPGQALPRRPHRGEYRRAGSGPPCGIPPEFAFMMTLSNTLVIRR